MNRLQGRNGIAPARRAATATRSAWPCVVASSEGITRLAVSVVPSAKRTQLDGFHDAALRVRLAAPPVDGRANEALVGWLADALGLPKRAVRLMHGASARRKIVEVDLDAATVERWLTGALGDG